MSSRHWGLLLLAVASRWASLSLLNVSPYYRMAPRSFTGSGFLVQPAWLDLAVPAVFILALWTAVPRERPKASALGKAALDALWILAFPLLAGLSLFLFVQRWLVKPDLDWASLLRFLQFVLAFVAMNVFLDHVTVRNVWARRGLALTLAAVLALSQDLISGPEMAPFRILILLSSVGTLLAATTWALRRVYRQSPVRAIVTATLVGGIGCFLVVAVRSDHIFPLALPALALLAGAATIGSARWWPRVIALFVVVALGLSCSLLLPRLVSPEQRAQMAESAMSAAHTEAIGQMTVSYDDPRVREVAVRMARVLEAANRVSRDSFGVSPEVRRLTIGGIAPGGFFADFPDGIVGNLPSERAAKQLLDSTFLNAPDASIHDLDPVNTILHEYAHLYGVVEYMPWVMGPEEEGWATYAATRLALRLYEKHGAGLWDPPYDYASRAREITRSNLQGRPVLWSHPDEFGGFRLWNALGERDGEVPLFQKRWRATRRDQKRFLLMFSDPEAARHMAAAFGETEFASFGKAAPVPLAQAVSREDLLRFLERAGVPPEPMTSRYDKRARQLIRPGVTVPESRKVLDGVIALLVLGVGGALLWHGTKAQTCEPANARDDTKMSA